jgi:hypothetical protein
MDELVVRIACTTSCTTRASQTNQWSLICSQSGVCYPRDIVLGTFSSPSGTCPVSLPCRIRAELERPTQMVTDRVNPVSSAKGVVVAVVTIATAALWCRNSSNESCICRGATTCVVGNSTSLLQRRSITPIQRFGPLTVRFARLQQKLTKVSGVHPCLI